MSLQLALSMGRVCALTIATASHGGVELLLVGVKEDRCGGGTSGTKASPLFPKTHRHVIASPLLRPTLRSVDYGGRVVQRNVVLGASDVKRVRG